MEMAAPRVFFSPAFMAATISATGPSACFRKMRTASCAASKAPYPCPNPSATEHCGPAAFGGLGPCVATNLLALFSDRHSAPVRALPATWTAARVKHGEHGRTLAGKRRNLEGVAEPPQRPKPRARTAGGGEPVAGSRRQIRNSGALVKRQNLHAVAGFRLDQARDQYALRCVLQEVCRELGRHKGDAPGIGFVETGPFCDTDALTPCFCDMARVLNVQLQLHPISSGLSKHAFPDRPSIQW